MDRDGVDAELVNGPYEQLWQIKDPELRVACVRVVNDWARELYEESHGRFIMLLPLPCQTPEEAVAELEPYLLGKELWRETRIPLFEQATDTRGEELKAQGVRPRVWFGERWITSIFDLFEENVRYFPALLPVCEDEDPERTLEGGGVPQLGELRLHNGTVYRWNRPIYDIVKGRPHLRVENRVLPAGPTVVDGRGWRSRRSSTGPRLRRR